MKSKAIMAILVAALVLGSVAASMAQPISPNTEKVKVIPEELSDVIEERAPLEEKEINLTIGESITKEILYEKMKDIASLPEIEKVYLDQKVFVDLNESRVIVRAEET
jgi:hypothetical protein